MVDTADAIVLIAALASTWAMTGVIWVIQLVHYPTFDAVAHGSDDNLWRRFGDRHRRSISYVVGPFMVAEGVTGIWLVADPPGGLSLGLPLIAGALMAIAYGTQRSSPCRSTSDSRRTSTTMRVDASSRRTGSARLRGQDAPASSPRSPSSRSRESGR